MSLIGSFSLYPSQRIGRDAIFGNMLLWQFVLKNTNMMFAETVDVMLCDCYGQKPFFFRQIKLKAGQSVVFNHDTVDWDWCQDDFAAIVDSNNRILAKWQFHLKEYAPGECPECHGTKKCRKCNGHGYIFPRGRIWESQPCDRCSDGSCPICDIPRREPIAGMGPTGLKPF